MTNHFLRNFSLPGCFIAVLFFQENAIFAFCMSCVLYALIWFFYSKCIKKYFLFHKNNIFSISQKSLSGDFLQKTWFQKKKNDTMLLFLFSYHFLCLTFQSSLLHPVWCCWKIFWLSFFFQDFYSSSISKNFSKKIFLGQLHWNLLLFQHSSSVLLSRSRWFRWL